MEVDIIKFNYKGNEIEFSNGINIIIGDNGVGKTHMLKQMIKENAIDYHGKHKKVGLGVPKHITERKDFDIISLHLKKLEFLYNDFGYIITENPTNGVSSKYIPILVEIFLYAERYHGKRIFISTHDYSFAKYFDILKKEENNIAFHSLYKTENGVKCETEERFDFLQNNIIIEEFINMYKAEIKKVME